MSLAKKQKLSKKNIDKKKKSDYFVLKNKKTPQAQYYFLNPEGEEYLYLSFYIETLRNMGISILNNEDNNLIVLANETSNDIYNKIIEKEPK